MYVCLAAGAGKRMAPLTGYLHKCMVPFHGLPFLAYTISSLPEKTVVVIIVNYLSEQISNYFGDCYRGRRILYLRQPALLGTGDALFHFSEVYNPNEPVIVWQADQLMLPVQLEAMAGSEANAILFSEADGKQQEIALWKIKPASLNKLRSHFENGEFRALPALRKEGFNAVKTPTRKLELSFASWNELDATCRELKVSMK